MAEESGRKQRGTGRPWPKGTSGNPKGRPKGSGLAGELRKAIAEDADDIVAALTERAKAGDVQAARVLLDRILPTVKPESITTPIPSATGTGSLLERAERLLEAVAGGDLAPDRANELLTALGALVKIQEATELEARIRALEARHES